MTTEISLQCGIISLERQAIKNHLFTLTVKIKYINGPSFTPENEYQYKCSNELIKQLPALQTTVHRDASSGGFVFWMQSVR